MKPIDRMRIITPTHPTQQSPPPHSSPLINWHQIDDFVHYRFWSMMEPRDRMRILSPCRTSPQIPHVKSATCLTHSLPISSSLMMKTCSPYTAAHTHTDNIQLYAYCNASFWHLIFSSKSMKFWPLNWRLISIDVSVTLQINPLCGKKSAK